MEKTYNVSEAAKKIGVSVKTLQRWDRDGKLVSKRTPSNRRYYTESQLAEIMEGEDNMEKYYVIEKKDGKDFKIFSVPASDEVKEYFGKVGFYWKLFAYEAVLACQ